MSIRQGKTYRIPYQIVHTCQRTGKTKTVKKGTPSDGATGDVDIFSEAWPVHDVLCTDGTWDDGTPCYNIEASFCAYDILNAENRKIRAVLWFVFTFAFGGGACRKNGMVPRKETK